MKSILLLYLFIVSIVAKPNEAPNEMQDADAAWLSNTIYDGVFDMDTPYGSIFHWKEKVYAIWQQKYTGECYVVIRGTKSPRDYLTDITVGEYVDNEIGVKVHYGVKQRTDEIFNHIGDQLKICNGDIIITGHSLGGAVAHYLFLKYVKKHYYDWGLKNKACNFKAVMFGAPQLVSETTNKFLKQQENYINYYKYENDLGPELIRTVRRSWILEKSLSVLSWINIDLFKVPNSVYQTICKVSYGDYIPGNKYHLLKNGQKKSYPEYKLLENLSLSDHVSFYLTVNALTKNVW